MTDSLKQRPIRFRRGWQRRAVGSIGSPAELTYGQRDALVMRGIAEWIEEPQEQKPRRVRRQPEETEQCSTS